MSAVGWAATTSSGPGPRAMLPGRWPETAPAASRPGRGMLLRGSRWPGSTAAMRGSPRNGSNRPRQPTSQGPRGNWQHGGGQDGSSASIHGPHMPRSKHWIVPQQFGQFAAASSSGRRSAGRTHPGCIDAETGAESAVQPKSATSKSTGGRAPRHPDGTRPWIVAGRHRPAASPCRQRCPGCGCAGSSASSRALAANAAGRAKCRCTNSTKAGRGVMAPIRR